MKYLLALLAVTFAGCAETSVSVNGQKVFRTQADIGHLEYWGPGGSHLVMDNVNHSNPTRAGGDSITKAATGIAAIGTAVALK